MDLHGYALHGHELHGYELHGHELRCMGTWGVGCGGVSSVRCSDFSKLGFLSCMGMTCVALVHGALGTEALTMLDAQISLSWDF